MENLKVLIVTNHGSIPAELSKLSTTGFFTKSEQNQTRANFNSFHNQEPHTVEESKEDILFMCSIGQAFSNSSFKISYAFPNLQELNIDYCSDLWELPVDLCDLIELRKLNITHCHKPSALPSEIGKLINLEVLRLKSCTDLVTFPASTTNLEKLNHLDISDCFNIKELGDNIGEISTLQKINLRQRSRVQDLPPAVFDLEQPEEVICDEETKELWEIFGLDVQKHKGLERRIRPKLAPKVSILKDAFPGATSVCLCVSILFPNFLLLFRFWFWFLLL